MRTATTTDVFAALADPKRRALMDLLRAGHEQPVGELVVRSRLPQPAVSKHLALLRKVGVVTVQKRGQQRLYRIAPQALKPVHDWVKSYERLWSDQLKRIKNRAERVARARPDSNAPSDSP